MYQPGTGPRRCRICGTKLPVQTPPAFDHCNAPPCLQAVRPTQTWTERFEQRDRERVAMARPALDHALARAGLGADAPDLVLAVTWHTSNPMEAAQPGPRAEFVAHLSDIIARAFDPDCALPEPRKYEQADDLTTARRADQMQPDNPVMTALCIACKGTCCLEGRSTHAFLTQRSIAWVRQMRPEMTAEALLDTYLGHLPEAHVAGSCLFHGERGCTLPRDLRADICNRFSCQRRQDAERRMNRTDATQAVVVGIEEVTAPDGQVQLVGRSVVLTADGTYVIDEDPDLSGVET